MLNLEYAKGIQTEVIDAGISKWSQYQRGTRIHNEKDKKAEAILDEEQFKAYREVRKEMTKRIKQGALKDSGGRTANS